MSKWLALAFKINNLLSFNCSHHWLISVMALLRLCSVMCFVDFASAFDSVDRDSLWHIIAVDGMPPKLLKLIKAYYSSTNMKVRASGSDSMSF